MKYVKNIHIGNLIETKWNESQISIERTCNFMNSHETVIREMFSRKSLDSETILKWSKLLEYDFFRIYSQHLILYAPVSNANYSAVENTPSSVPQFRKNLYTRELIYFILNLLQSKRKTAKEIIDEYRIPKTTLYKWMSKYKTDI